MKRVQSSLLDHLEMGLCYNKRKNKAISSRYRLEKSFLFLLISKFCCKYILVLHCSSFIGIYLLILPTLIF